MRCKFDQKYKTNLFNSHNFQNASNFYTNQYLLIPNRRTPWNCGSFGINTTINDRKFTVKWLRSFFVYKQARRNLKVSKFRFILLCGMIFNDSVLQYNWCNCQKFTSFCELLSMVYLFPMSISSFGWCIRTEPRRSFDTMKEIQMSLCVIHESLIMSL